jgi:phosphoglycolate phosphatase-like HAD superfamily hydrolase
MEIKHKECFCPQCINHFGLQPVSKYAREAWDFVNLYSKTRGCNRFLAVLHVMDWLADREEVKARNCTPPRLPGLRAWTGRETKLGNPALEAEVAKTADPDLKLALDWSLDVNANVKKIVRNVPPFPWVRESLEKIKGKGDIVVVSATPGEALMREWEEHGISRYARIIAGQEMGSKKEHLALAAKDKYPSEKILMVGDAPGDMKAAQANHALFYPINPGAEEKSWQRFHDEAVGKFFKGEYAGDYEAKAIAEFEEYLPEKPPWK